jgi:hypothetical protein
MTTNFVSAANLMSRVLGMPDYRFCTIDHPVSSASDQELAQRAQTTIDAILQLMLEH